MLTAAVGGFKLRKEQRFDVGVWHSLAVMRFSWYDIVVYRYGFFMADADLKSRMADI